MFTTATLPSLGFAAKHHNVALEDKLTSNPALAVVAGVSAEVGLEAHHILPKSIDSDAFIQFLLTILTRSNAKEFAIVVDNCRVHHCKKVKKFVVENQIAIIYLVAYGPEFNPIERVWSKIKLQLNQHLMTWN
jgi:hypothetical protein